MSQKKINVSDIMYIMQSGGHNIPSVVFLPKTHNLNLTMNIRQIQIRGIIPKIIVQVFSEVSRSGKTKKE